MAGQGGLVLSEALSDLDLAHRLAVSSPGSSHAAPPKGEAMPGSINQVSKVPSRHGQPHLAECTAPMHSRW